MILNSQEQANMAFGLCNRSAGEGTPSPEKQVPCQPASRPVLLISTHGEKSQPIDSPGDGESTSISEGHDLPDNALLETSKEHFGPNANYISSLQQELQSSEAEIAALRSALDAASEEIRYSKFVKTTAQCSAHPSMREPVFFFLI
jgi:hypothetical protein